MANEFIARKGLIALENSQITGSLSVTNSVTASFFTGSYRGDGSQLTGIEGFPFTGSAKITGSLEVTGSVIATTFIGDGSQLTGIADPTPITATINNTNSPFTITSQSIVIIDSTNGDVTVNLPDLDAIVGTSNQKPILLYKNDYSQNVIYVEPSGSQLVNGTTQDIIVSIQIAIAYNPTSAGWVTEGTSYQSLAELELFFVPRTETGSFATTGSNQFSGSQTITGSLTVTGNITGNITGSASTASYVEYTNVANKPVLVSGSSQITYSGLTGIPSGILSGSTQIAAFGYATTGSNGFNGNQAITGSLTVTGQVVAQTLNVQQVTSSIVYSSGSNVFGNSVSNTQQFTGSMLVTGSLAVTGAGTFSSSVTATGGTEIPNGQFYRARRSSSNLLIDLLGIESGTDNTRLLITGDFNIKNGSLATLLNMTTAGTTTFLGPTVTIGTAVAATNVKLILNGVASKAAGIEFHQSGTPQWYIGNGIASEDNNFELYNSNGTMAIKIIKSTNAINFTGAATFSSSVMANGLATSANYKLGTTGAAFISGANNKGVFITDNASYASIVGLNSAISAYNPIELRASGTDYQLYLSTNGNVGIGTASPDQKLQVDGNISLGRFNVGSSRYVGLTNGGGGFGDSSGSHIEFTSSSSTNGINFYTYNGTTYSEKMRITSGGGVSLKGPFLSMDAAGLGSSPAGLGYGLFPYSGIGLGISSVVGMRFLTGTTPTDRMSIDSSGNIGAPTGTNIYNASDSRLKQNIEAISNGLDKISALNPVKFNWVDGFVPSEDGKDMLGFVAQEVYEVIPEAVENFGNNSIIVNDIEIENPLRVNEKFIIPVLVKAIQEQQSQIEILKAEIQTLKQ